MSTTARTNRAKMTARMERKLAEKESHQRFASLISYTEPSLDYRRTLYHVVSLPYGPDWLKAYEVCIKEARKV